MQRGNGVRKGRGAAGRIHRAIPEEGIQNAGQAAGQRDDGDRLACAFDILRRELRTTMALAGQTSVKELGRDFVFRVD